MRVVDKTTKTKRGRRVTHSWHACGHASSIVHRNPSRSGRTRPPSPWPRISDSVYAFRHAGKWVEKSGWFAAVAGPESTVCIYIYIYNYTLFPHFLSILRLISFFNYFYSMMELLLLLHLRAPSSHIHERINIYNEYNEFVRSKNKRRVFHKAILLSRILFNTVYIPNRIVFLT